MPLFAGAFIAITAIVWIVALGTLTRRGLISRSGLLRAGLWVTVASGGTITVLRRIELDAVASQIVLVSTAVLLFIGAISLFAHRRGEGKLNRALLVVTVILTILELVYMFLAGGPIASHVQEESSLAFLPLFVYLVYQSGSTREQLLRLAGSAAAVIVTGSVLLAFILPDFAYAHFQSDQRRVQVLGLMWRLGGLAPHPNLLSLTALVAIVIAFAVRSRMRWVVFAMSLLALGLAESRVAIVSLGVVAVVAWFFRGGSVVGRALVSAPVILILVWLIANLVPSEDASVLTSDLATNGRFRVWALVEGYFWQNPLQGYGPLAFQPDGTSPYLDAGLLHAHNQILQAVAETGLLGGLLTVVMLAIFVFMALQRPIRPVYPALVAAFLASSPTEPFLSLHLYGMNFAVVPAFLFITAIMSTGMKSEPAPELGAPVAAVRKPAGRQVGRAPHGHVVHLTAGVRDSRG
ncbi:MAG: O-antigen ligase family protein [Microbacterium sp.]|uniref:O-antigen ligase family protein n=1 Tax=Microbacterium sp. TaxID=51671 RepID=UPI002623BC1B|nr:O-antigen ligase family protein [Microbacterium sp.]MCX6501596.1 O-antigen ligase family protein [Microbacterium sp.]